ncbi:MAG: hypothetical protein ABIQ59_08765 [Nocardioidaceae bacterium]
MHATGRSTSRLVNVAVVVGVALAVALTTMFVPTLEAQFSKRATSRITATWTSSQAALGENATVRGRVYSRYKSGRAVNLYSYLKSGWRRVAYTRTGANGYYTVKLPTGYYFKRPMQLRVGATSKAAGGTTASRPFAVVPAYAPGGLTTDWVARARGKEYRFNPCVPVTFAMNNTQGTPGAVADVKAAFALVHQATGITFTSLGTTTAYPQAGAVSPADILVAWGTQADTGFTLPPESMSYGGLLDTNRAHDAQGPVTRIVKAAIMVNSAENSWIDEHAASQMRVRVLMHEIGAVVGLGPVVARYQRMQEGVYPVDTTNWGAGDLAGFSRVGLVEGCVTDGAYRAK